MISGELQLSTLSRPDLFDSLHFHNLALRLGDHFAAPFCPRKPSRPSRTMVARFSAWIRQGHLFRMPFSIVVPPEYFNDNRNGIISSSKPLLNLSWGKNKRLAQIIAPWTPPAEQVVSFSAEVDVGEVRIGQPTSDPANVVRRTCETKLKLGSFGGPVYKIQQSCFPPSE